MESGLPNWSRGAWAHGTGSGVLGVLFIAAGNRVIGRCAAGRSTGAGRVLTYMVVIQQVSPLRARTFTQVGFPRIDSEIGLKHQPLCGSRTLD